MSTKAQRAFAYVDDAVRAECADGAWLPDVGEWWGEYENIVATHVTRRIRGGWAIDLAVTITWDGMAPIVRSRTTKFHGVEDWTADAIKAGISDTIGAMIQADRETEDGMDFDAVYERIQRDKFARAMLEFRAVMIAREAGPR